jgi:hypothetical protein
MLISPVLIVLAENCDSICKIAPRGGHLLPMASDLQLAYGWIEGFFVGLPLLKHHHHWYGKRSGPIHSELCQDHPNVAVLMDVNCVMRPIAFNVHAEIEREIHETMHRNLFCI